MILIAQTLEIPGVRPKIVVGVVVAVVEVAVVVVVVVIVEVIAVLIKKPTSKHSVPMRTSTGIGRHKVSSSQ